MCREELFFARGVGLFFSGGVGALLFLAGGGRKLNVHQIALGVEQKKTRFFIDVNGVRNDV